MKFPKKIISDLPLDGATVLVRADYNVPLGDNGSIDDDYRIRQSLPTLQYLRRRKCKVVICAHLGRPDGKVEAQYSLEPVARCLEALLNAPVRFVPACTGDQVKQAMKATKPGEVVLLENLRFHPEEEENNEVFARKLAKDTGAVYFVQDGFGVVHRSHASTSAITHFLPSVGGLLLKKEWTAINRAMHLPERPLVVIVGGAKISDKIKVIKRFVDIADTVIIGGAMANTFLKFSKRSIGKSKAEEGVEDIIQHIYDHARAKIGEHGDMDSFLVLPSDVAVGTSIDEQAERRVVSIDAVGENDIILDLGSDSIDKATNIIRSAKTAIWNGTLGYAELEQFSYGSARMALEMAQQPDMTSIIGGGDTADFVLHWDAKNGGSFTHVSTGGGASLELMAGDPMPGIDALLDA